MRFVCATITMLLLAGSASAAEVDSTTPTVDLQLFLPAPGANNLITVESGDVNAHLGLNAGLSLSYANKPLVVQFAREDGTIEPVGNLVGWRFDATLLAAFGLFDIADIGVALPFVMQGGLDSDKLEQTGIAAGTDALKLFTLGNLRVVPKVRFLHLADGLFSAALVATVIVPTAGDTAYASENGMVYAPSIALSSRTKTFQAALNVGYRLRDRTKIEPVPGETLLIVDDELFAKLGVALDLTFGGKTPIFAVAEAYGHTPSTNAFGTNALTDLASKKQGARTSLEGILGLRLILVEHLILTAGGGAGLTPYGYGQAKPRVFASLSYYTGEAGVADADKDGVSDSSDKCPDKKEDKDNFQDFDGCPDSDNDKDRVADEDDQCRDQPEDKDNLGDDDGCPETDFDNDGVLDESDKCPKEAEDKDSFQDDDGCADLDNDGDSFADAVDKCPGEKEDVDGFQDIDGCLDNDNDDDKLPDLGDMCPNNAEDMDGVADDDGCPDDNDNDGIADDADKCPAKAEVYNGIEDEDGCPEKVAMKSLVNVTEDKIEIKETVYFATGSAKILPKSFNLLDQVASVLRNYKHIRKVRVEGHTDSKGPRKKNLKLSRERAESVRQYLIEKGIEAGRLDFEGFGPDKPIASNNTNNGREMNRRVEFVIVEQKPIGQDVSETEPTIEMMPEPPAPAPAVAPPAPAPTAPAADPLFEVDGGAATPAPAEPKLEPAPPPPAAEPEPKKKKKGKKKEKEPEIEFNF